MDTTNTTRHAKPAPSQPSLHDQLEAFEERLDSIDEAGLDHQAAIAAKKDGGSLEGGGTGLMLGHKENYALGAGEGKSEEATRHSEVEEQLSTQLEIEELAERFNDIDESALDHRVAIAAKKDGASMRGGGTGLMLGHKENYVVGGGEGEEGCIEGEDEEGDLEMDGVEGGNVDGGVDGSKALTVGEGEDETAGGKGEKSVRSGIPGEFLLYRQPVPSVFNPVCEDCGVGEGVVEEDEDKDMVHVVDDLFSDLEDQLQEDDNDGGPTPSFTLRSAPATRDPRNHPSFNVPNNQEFGEEEQEEATTSSFSFHAAPAFTLPNVPSTRDPRNNTKGSQPIYFGALGRAIEPVPSSPALSEAETIILPSRNPKSRIGNRSRVTSLSPTPTTGSFPPSAKLSTPVASRTFSNLQAWRYKDVQLPKELPKTMAQWARLEPKVRMITPLPDVVGKGKVSDAFVENVRERFGEMTVKEQKRVVEVVRKSRVSGGFDDEWEFLTGSDKKSRQINWDNLSNQAFRNAKSIIEIIEYEDFTAELAETNGYPAVTTSPSNKKSFRVVKRDDNYWGIGWSLRGSTGKFEGLTEDEMLAFHREVYPKSEVLDPELVLGARREDGKREVDDEDVEAARMPKKDEIKGSATKVLGRRPGMLKGGEPGVWSFWVEQGDLRLRDWVLSAQDEA